MDFGYLAASWPTEDGIPPKPPTGVRCTAGDQSVDLDWLDNTEADLAGYNVYRSTTSGSDYSKINTTLIIDSSYLETTVANGTTYYYVVTAQDKAANDSYPSSEQSATPHSDLVLYLEVEDGSGITGSWTIGNDATASNGHYLVWTGSDSTAAPPASEHITYAFTAPVTDLYKVYLRVITNNSSSDDSCWIKIDDADINQSVQITRADDWVKFNSMCHVTSWTWDQVHNEEVSGNPAVEFYLSSGIHTLRIGYRENGTKMDRIFITNTIQNP